MRPPSTFALSSYADVCACVLLFLPSFKKNRDAKDKGNWAKLVKRAESGAVKIRGATYATSAYGHGGGGGGVSSISGGGGGSSASSSSSIQVKVEPSSSSAIVKPDKHARGRFVMPAVGANGAQTGFLNGKTVVITGIFPEVGGGAGLNLGKDKLKVRNR